MAAKSKATRPTHEAFVVIRRRRKVHFGPRSVASPHDDGKGFNVELIALPISGRIVIRERKETTTERR